MKVRCIDSKDTFLLKHGDICNVTAPNNDEYCITDGENKGVYFSKSRFEIVDDVTLTPEEIKALQQENFELINKYVEARDNCVVACAKYSFIQQENTELKKALELACKFISDEVTNKSSFVSENLLQDIISHYIKQAEEDLKDGNE